ncbi:MAG: SDR family oxidoreductase [Candidatus Ranarchaeia archaeon]
MSSITDYPMHVLTHQVVVVTGASSGMGRATALLLAKKGCRLALIGRRKKRLETVGGQAEKNGALDVLSIQCDVRKPDDVHRAIDEILRRWNRIDVLLNVAGLALRGAVDGYALEDWNTVIDTDLTGVFLMCREVLPYMKRQGQGQIINVSSGAGRNGIANMASYSAAKFGVIGFTESLGLEVRNDNIRVSVICPGSTVSEFHRVAGRVQSPAPPKPSYALYPEEVAGVIEAMLTQPSQAWMSYVVLRPLNTSLKRPLPDTIGHDT